MKGSWLRKSRAKLLATAVLTASLVVLPFPAVTNAGSVGGPAGFSFETKAYAPYRGIFPRKEPLAEEAAPATEPAVATAPELEPEAVPEVIQVAQVVAPRLTAPQEPARRAPLLPNLFGTVAVATSMAPDGWVDHVDQGAAFDACLSGAASCGSRAGTWRNMRDTLAGLSLRDRLQRANSFVNHNLYFRYDSAATGRADSWSSPSELLRTGGGDCEDFALAKYWLLRATGVPEEDMYVMIVRDAVARADHAYLAVRTGDSFVLLDSRVDGVLPPHMLDEITPVFSITATNAYLHGRRV